MYPPNKKRHPQFYNTFRDSTCISMIMPDLILIVPFITRAILLIVIVPIMGIPVLISIGKYVMTETEYVSFPR